MKKRLVWMVLLFCVSICSGCVSSTSTGQKAAGNTEELQEALLANVAVTEMWADLLSGMDLSPEEWQPFADKSERTGVLIEILRVVLKHKEDKPFIQKYTSAIKQETPLSITQGLIELNKDISESMEMEMSKADTNDIDVTGLRAMNDQSLILKTVCEALAEGYSN